MGADGWATAPGRRLPGCEVPRGGVSPPCSGKSLLKAVSSAAGFRWRVARLLPRLCPPAAVLGRRRLSSVCCPFLFSRIGVSHTEPCDRWGPPGRRWAGGKFPACVWGERGEQGGPSGEVNRVLVAMPLPASPTAAAERYPPGWRPGIQRPKPLWGPRQDASLQRKPRRRTRWCCWGQRVCPGAGGGGRDWGSSRSTCYRPASPSRACLWPSSSAGPRLLRQKLRGKYEGSEPPSQSPVGAHARRGPARARGPPRGRKFMCFVSRAAGLLLTENLHHCFSLFPSLCSTFQNM